jgi:hypothetical protein
MSIDNAKPKEWDRMSKTSQVNCITLKIITNPVTQPDHYNKGAIEAIEAIKASMHPQEYKGYLKGNCLKYLWRIRVQERHRGSYVKHRVYLEWLIKEVANV